MSSSIAQLQPRLAALHTHLDELSQQVARVRGMLDRGAVYAQRLQELGGPSALEALEATLGRTETDIAQLQTWFTNTTTTR